MTGKRYVVRAPIALAVWIANLVACSSAGHPAPSGAADAAVVSCVTPADCEGVLPPDVYCCINSTCTVTPPACTSQPIQAASYDQICSNDSDCVAVGEGNACLPGELNCPAGAINSGAYAQYKADVAKTNAAVCWAVSTTEGSIGHMRRSRFGQVGEVPAGLGQTRSRSRVGRSDIAPASGPARGRWPGARWGTSRRSGVQAASVTGWASPAHRVWGEKARTRSATTKA